MNLYHITNIYLNDVVCLSNVHQSEIRDVWVQATIFARNKEYHQVDETMWSPFRWRPFQMQYHQWKILHFDSNFTEVCSWGSNWQRVCIGSGNGLVPNRRQAITWTNLDPVHLCMYAALGGDELSFEDANPELVWYSIKDTTNLHRDTGSVFWICKQLYFLYHNLIAKQASWWYVLVQTI